MDGAIRIQTKRQYIPIVRIMFRKKAKVRFEYFLQDIEKMLSPTYPSTNDETGSPFFYEGLRWHHHWSMGTASVSVFRSMSYKKYSKLYPNPIGTIFRKAV